MMHRPSAPKQQINLRVDAIVHRNLAKRAQDKGLSITGYSQMLFDAAYAARVGREKDNPVADAELDEQVRAVFCLAGEFDPPAIAKALGLTETLVAKVLTGWKKQGRA